MTDTEEVTEDDTGTVYADVYTFVGEVIAKLYAHPVGTQEKWRWCDQWFLHHEALTRLEACWLAWESLRLEAKGTSEWLYGHADPCMAALSNQVGPFRGCAPGRHSAPPFLPTSDPLPLLEPDAPADMPAMVMADLSWWDAGLLDLVAAQLGDALEAVGLPAVVIFDDQADVDPADAPPMTVAGVDLKTLHWHLRSVTDSRTWTDEHHWTPIVHREPAPGGGERLRILTRPGS